MSTISTTCSGNYGNHYYLYLDYTLNSQSISGNYSNITLHLYAQADSSSYGAYNLNNSNPYYVYVNGSAVTSGSEAMDFRGCATVSLGYYTGNVYHNSDGTLTITIGGSFSISGTSSLSSGSISGSWTLPTIPRASNITSFPNFTFGSSIAVSVPRASSGFTNKLQLNVNGTVILTRTGIGDSTTITMSTAELTTLYNNMVGVSSRTATLYCTTMNGSTQIGNTVSANSTVSVKPPTITGFTLTRCNADGSANTTGTSVKVVSTGTASSVITTAEQNTLTYIVYSKARGTSTWTTLKTATISGLSLSATDIFSTYGATSSFDFRLDIADKFSTTISVGTVSTGLVTVSLGNNGVGVGKVWEQGALDIGGSLNATGGESRFTSTTTYTDPWVNTLCAIKTNGNIAAGGYLYSNTGNGTIQVGSQNTGYCHYVTDRPKHWFNQTISTGGLLEFYPYGVSLGGQSNGSFNFMSGHGNNWQLDYPSMGLWKYVSGTWIKIAG